VLGLSKRRVNQKRKNVAIIQATTDESMYKYYSALTSSNVNERRAYRIVGATVQHVLSEG